MNTKCTVAFAVATALASTFLFTTLAAAQHSPRSQWHEIRRCTAIAAPAVKVPRTDVVRKSDVEIQKELPRLLERFAARPELAETLACLMRYEAAH